MGAIGKPRYFDARGNSVEHTPAGVHFQQLTTVKICSVVRLNLTIEFFSK